MEAAKTGVNRQWLKSAGVRLVYARLVPKVSEDENADFLPINSLLVKHHSNAVVLFSASNCTCANNCISSHKIFSSIYKCMISFYTKTFVYYSASA